MTARRITLETLRNDLIEHSKSDLVYYKKFNDHLAIYSTNNKELKRLGDLVAKLSTDMEPIMQTFNDNKIVRMRLSSDFKTIVFYSAGITTIGALLYGILFWLKSVIGK